jgi:hypothetical protein
MQSTYLLKTCSIVWNGTTDWLFYIVFNNLQSWADNINITFVEVGNLNRQELVT